MSTYRGRTAPTPSGALHLGNLRTALLAWLLARQAGGQFVLRLEDLDRARVRPGAAGAALDDMRWLGLDWDEGPDRGGPHAPYLQSERGAIYAAHLRRLQDADLVYPCYCSRADIARAATAPHGAADDGPRYPGTCRDPDLREQQRRRASGRPPALRFRSPDRVIGLVDGLYGAVEQNVAREVGDVVVCRADGMPSYQLAVVVDDALMDMTDVVRGADLLPSTPRQIALYQALGYAVPRFLHVPLVLDRQGERLAKRQDACGATALRQAGLPPARVVGAMAASVGLVEQGVEVTAQELRARANVGRLSRDASSILF